MGPPSVDPVRQAVVLVTLLLLTPWATADVSDWQGPDVVPDSAGNDPSNSTYEAFVMPSNHTITDAKMEISPSWIEAGDNGTYWDSQQTTGFSLGTSNNTSSLGYSGDLTLSAQSSYGVMTDFETKSLQFSSWSTEGDGIWQPVNVSKSSCGPTNSTDGVFVAGTCNTALVGQNTTSILRSQYWSSPNIIRNMTVSFDRWISMDSDDKASFEVSSDWGKNWFELENWTGTMEQWEREEYVLDNLAGLSANSGIGFRFIIDTSNNSSADEGMFVDSFNFANDGEPLGAWFHGNQNGQYSNYADGSVVIPVDLTGFAGPLEFKYWANWDIEGDYNDNLVITISLDNGSTWTTVSPSPGVPGLGIPFGGTSYTQQSYDTWIDIQHPLPAWVVGHANASDALLKFRVRTDGVKNFGGSAIDGWEGIMFDDLTIVSVNNATIIETPINNLSSTNGHYYINTTGSSNDWQYITWEGHNGPWSTSDSFEINQMLPEGWRIDHERGSTPWEIGAIDNSNNFGPNSSQWPSGTSGMGVNLDGKYGHKTFTHLISPTYHIPESATARLTFQHWICTEAAWDGGAVYTSVDDGSTWQYYGENISGFYERYSQVNPYSPFHNHGIFDGSTVANGCGNNNSASTFNSKSGDISYLAGSDVRIRFSFFSDTYLAEDGWYIDDAGIEIDRFVDNGTWTSPLIDVDEAGWGKISALIDVPNETGLNFDILDHNGVEIPGYSNQSSDLELHLGAWEYDSLQIRVNMWTENESLTPRLKLLHHGMTTHLNAENVEIENQYQNFITIHENGTVENVGSNASDIAYFDIDWKEWRPYQDIIASCDGDAVVRIYSSFRDLLPINSSWQQTIPSGYEDSGNCKNGTSLSLLDAKISPSVMVVLSPGQWFKTLKIEPVSLRSPKNIAIDLGADNSVDWRYDGYLGHDLNLTSVTIDGQQAVLNDSRGLEIPFNSNFTFTTRTISAVYPYSPYYWNRIDGCASVSISGNLEECWQPDENVTQNILVEGVVYRYQEQIWSMENLSAGVLKIIAINMVTDVPYIWQISNERATQAFNNQSGYNSVMPVKINSERAGVELNGSITHSPTITDEWITVPSTTIIPGRTITAVSKHNNLLSTPDLESVTLQLSSSRNPMDTLAEFQIDSFSEGGRFVQNFGLGIISLDSTNSSWDGEIATWILTGSWNLDDFPRLYWLVSATNSVGLTAGPVVGVSGSGEYAASTNDLEIIGLKAWSQGNILHDYSDFQWPFNVQSGSEVTIAGEVRFSGLDGVHPLPNDVELNVNLLDGMSSHLTTVVPVLGDGSFNTTIIASNNENESGNNMMITASLSRVGPQGSSTAVEANPQNEQIPFILDAFNAEVTSLVILAPGGAQPADGHVWNPGQEIPLRLSLTDDSGLPDKMMMHYSRSGRAWESVEFLTPIGAVQATIDLPLIDDASIPLIDQEDGWLDVYFTGYDLAGNPLIGGGNESEPLARIEVQKRKPTWVDSQSLSLDRDGGVLYPGYSHEFKFTLSDDNGIESLDLIRFGLIDNSSEDCWFEWTPWNGDLSNDVGCYYVPPRIEISKYPLVNTWDVTITFELRWDLGSNFGNQVHNPWLHIYDEDDRTGKGFNSITPLNWSLHSGIELIFDEIEDIVAPLGEYIDDVMYIHSQDIIDFHMLVIYAGTQIPANNLPYDLQVQLQIIGNGTETNLAKEINSDGTVTIRVVFSEAIYGKQIYISADLSPLLGHSSSGKTLTALIDSSDPTISLSPGVLASIDSNNLTQVPIELLILDSEGIGSSDLVMHWKYIRNGRVIDLSGGQAVIPNIFSSSLNHLHYAEVDMSPNGDIVLQKGDGLLVWFNGNDASGRELSGVGTTDSQPLQPILRWIAYEPELGEMVASPYRPQFGDIITIEISVKNIGLLDGNSTIRLYDFENILLGNITLEIPAEGIEAYKFEIEAWSTGDLGLNIQIDNQTPIPVPLAEVSEIDDGASQMESSMLTLSIIAVFVAGFILLIANNRKQQTHSFYEEEE